MMYATQQDLERHGSEAQIVALTDRAIPPAGVADADVVNQALDGASGTIDGYLRGRYAVPVDPVPVEIRDACVKLAFKELHVNGVYPEAVKQDYDDTIAWLKDASRGVVILPIDLAPAPAGAAQTVEIEEACKTFGGDAMKGFG